MADLELIPHEDFVIDDADGEAESNLDANAPRGALSSKSLWLTVGACLVIGLVAGSYFLRPSQALVPAGSQGLGSVIQEQDSNINVKVCGFPAPASKPDPKQVAGPRCAEGFNKARTAGCPGSDWEMKIFVSGDKAYCAYSGGTYSGAMDKYKDKIDKCFADGPDGTVLFISPGPPGQILDVDQKVVAGFPDPKMYQGGDWSCNGGECTWKGAGPCGPGVIKTFTIQLPTVQTVTCGSDDVSFVWSTADGYTQITRYVTGSSSRFATIKNNMNGGIGLSMGNGINNCDIKDSWPVTGVGDCDNYRGEDYLALSGSITINCD